MAKRNPIRTIQDSNGAAPYHNRRTLLFIGNTRVLTNGWECPDGTGYWIVTSRFANNESKVVHRIKISPMGDILEESND